MKKLLIPLALVIITVAATSCKKNYVCECYAVVARKTQNGHDSLNRYLVYSKDVEGIRISAKKQCRDYQNSYSQSWAFHGNSISPDSYIDCELK